MILFGVTTGRHIEFDWTFRGGLARFFPEQWDRLRAAVPVAERDGDMVEAYHRLLHDPDPAVCQRAAEAWCTWESATPAWPPTKELSDRFRDPKYALALTRIVMHYVRHNAWLEDEVLLRGAGALAGIPGILVNGRFDFQAPIANVWELKRVWPRAEVVIVDDAGHLPRLQQVGVDERQALALGQALQLLLRHPGRDDVPARGDQGLDHGGAEPAGPAGDYRGAVHVRSVSRRSTFVA
jgi:proline iminopeptidase